MTSDSSPPQTLYDKIWNQHVVTSDGDRVLLYIDRHLVHEVTSPQAFEGLQLAGRPLRKKELTLVTLDHNIPTQSRKTYKSISSFVKEPDSKTQCVTLEENVVKYGLHYFGLDDKRQGIVHIIGPEQGFTLPGTTVVCGDSHTSTHGAFGALAFGIGTSEVEHVLATQTLWQKKSKNMLIKCSGRLPTGCVSKDLMLHIIGVIGTAGGTGYVVEFAGEAIEDLSIEARMSMCNMSIEAGARAGLVAPDNITIDYLKDRPLAPKGEEWEIAAKYWLSLRSDSGATYDKVVEIDASSISPTVTWGTSPQDVVPITGTVPNPEDPSLTESRRKGMIRSIEYMGLKAGEKLTDVKIDRVFIGSCTNARIEDLRSAAKVVVGRKVAPNVNAMIVPGSGLVKDQAEAEGLDKIFIEAGFDWREAGCSMCLGMNPDQLGPKERCASTSNRNFEGRQGPLGRTHLMSPAMAAAAAIKGHLADVRELISDVQVPKNTEYFVEDNYKFGLGAKRDSEGNIIDAVEKESKLSTESSKKAKLESTEESSRKFKSLQTIPIPYELPNVDTDMIIPKQFLKTIKRSGLGQFLFFESRFDPKTKNPNPNFVLNKEPYSKSNVLVAFENFGCGSSREHAPWALYDFGIRCIIADGFGDIFRSNCLKNGLLLISLPINTCKKLIQLGKDKKKIEVRLEPKTEIEILETGEIIEFSLPENDRQDLIKGEDEIAKTLTRIKEIETYEEKRKNRYTEILKDGSKSYDADKENLTNIGLGYISLGLAPYDKQKINGAKKTVDW